MCKNILLYWAVTYQLIDDVFHRRIIAVRRMEMSGVPYTSSLCYDQFEMIGIVRRVDLCVVSLGLSLCLCVCVCVCVCV